MEIPVAGQLIQIMIATARNMLPLERRYTHLQMKELPKETTE